MTSRKSQRKREEKKERARIEKEKEKEKKAIEICQNERGKRRERKLCERVCHLT
jgi:hypothetical protein